MTPEVGSLTFVKVKQDEEKNLENQTQNIIYKKLLLDDKSRKVAVHLQTSLKSRHVIAVKIP